MSFLRDMKSKFIKKKVKVLYSLIGPNAHLHLSVRIEGLQQK